MFSVAETNTVLLSICLSICAPPFLDERPADAEEADNRGDGEQSSTHQRDIRGAVSELRDLPMEDHGAKCTGGTDGDKGQGGLAGNVVADGGEAAVPRHGNTPRK